MPANTIQEIIEFCAKGEKFSFTTEFAAKMSETEINFLDRMLYKGVRFDNNSILDVQTHYKPTETLPYLKF